MKLYTFSKEERLSHRSQIDALFQERQAFSASPLKIIYRFDPVSEPGVKILIAISKKKFRHAVTRNRLRRLIRESYRLHKQLLQVQNNALTFSLHVGFIYVGDKQDITLSDLEKPMTECLLRLHRILHESKREA
jgi:ribonuclease P protein component